ncbi:MAG: hypothetical protein ACM3PV_00325, partial [Betaproteobacteria bacterium]
MDRLIALVVLRWRLELRAVLVARSRVAALLVGLPALALLSLAASFVVFSLARVVEGARPELVLPGLSAVSGVLGLAWVLSPLLAGVAATETHDLGRLLHYPVPLPTLVASSLLANLLQPVVLAQLPPLGALAFALAGAGPRWPIALAGLLLALGLALAAGQAVGLALHALSRHRLWHDRALFAGIGLGLLLSLVPLLLLSAAGSGARRLVLELVARDAFVLLPFSWGARAAVHAARGEPAAFLAWAAGATVAIAATVAVSTALAQRLYRGELDLGDTGGAGGRRARVLLPGAIGALVEKDLRVTWRDPRLKALVFTGVVGPVIVLVALWQGTAGRVPAGFMLSLASFAGLGVLGSNVFGQERQAVALLLGFPVERLSILVAKNLGTMVLRLPALALVALAALVVSGPLLVPAVVTIGLLTELVALAIDNFVSLLHPLAVPGAGRDPSSAISGTRGLAAAVVAFGAMLASLLVSAPFAFLAWLPHLLALPWLWALALPLALGGAAGVYFMLTVWAARLLAHREPDLVGLA